MVVPALIALSTTLCQTLQKGSTLSITQMVGKPVPDFEMTTVDGKKISKKTLKGKPFVIDFWATWCGPCKKLSTVMQELHDELGPKGLTLIGADGFEDTKGPGPASDYAKEHVYTYTFTHSNDGLMSLWSVTALPTIVFVARDGQITRVQVGYGDQLKPGIKKSAAELVTGR